MKKSPFQFSLAAMLLTVAAIAGVLALMFQVPTEPARIALIVAVFGLSALAITGIINGQPALKTFCVGASVPLAIMLLFIAINFGGLVNSYASIEQINTYYALNAPSPLTFPMIPKFFGIGIIMGIALGYLCVGFRWLIERRESPDV